MRKFDLKQAYNDHTLAWGINMEKVKEILDGLYEFEDYYLTLPGTDVTQYVFPSGFRRNNIVRDVAWGDMTPYTDIVNHEFFYYGT